MVRSGFEIDWAAVRRRIRFIGSALGIAPTQVEEVLAEIAKGNQAKLVAFGETHGQGLDRIRHWRSGIDGAQNGRTGFGFEPIAVAN